MESGVVKQIVIFEDDLGRSPFIEWLSSLDIQTKYRINQRIIRLSHGNYGDFKMIDRDIKELRFHFGPGYRLYFGEDKGKIIVLLIGGDKSTQKRDINKAIQYWEEYKGNAND